jgi:hypothetical protein
MISGYGQPSKGTHHCISFKSVSLYRKYAVKHFKPSSVRVDYILQANIPTAVSSERVFISHNMVISLIFHHSYGKSYRVEVHSPLIFRVVERMMA